MTHVVDPCIAAGWVKRDVHAGVDGGQVRANASIHSLQEIEAAPVVSLSEYLTQLERQDQQECPIAGLDESQLPKSPPPSGSIRSDAPQGKGRGQEAHLRYLVHNVTDV